MSTDIIQQIYREMGLPAPEVIAYPQLHQAISDRQAWWPRVEWVVPVLWEYQYPVVSPLGDWAFRLFESGFQFDITRKRLENGVYVLDTYLSQIPIQAKVLFNYYRKAVDYVSRNMAPTSDAQLIVADSHFFEEIEDRRDQEDPTQDKVNYRNYLFDAENAFRYMAPTPLDTAIDHLRDDESQFFDEIEDRVYQEDRTLQAIPEEYLFLGARSWIAIEFRLLHAMREWIGLPLCDQHYKNVKLLHEHTGIFVTFGNLVISAGF